MDPAGCIAEHARFLAEREHFRSLALLAAGLADLQYPLHCRECRLYAERVVLRVIREAGLVPLMVIHESGFTRFYVIAWIPGSPRVVLFRFGHGGEADAAKHLSLVNALAMVHKRGGITSLSVSAFPELEEYVRLYRSELRRYEEMLGVRLEELLGRRRVR